ncbi:MAG: hypothetical protein WCP66_08490 [Methylococcales bacterium]
MLTKKVFEVDLANLIDTSVFLAPLKNRSLFVQAKVGFCGRSIDWIEDTLDLGSDNLRNFGVEQAGGIGHERIWTWLHECGFTLEQGAEALGISRCMLIYYRDGEKPIPRSIWLACLGWVLSVLNALICQCTPLLPKNMLHCILSVVSSR